jgi:serine/threonine protein phosphatase PrpC
MHDNATPDPTRTDGLAANDVASVLEALRQPTLRRDECDERSFTFSVDGSTAVTTSACSQPGDPDQPNEDAYAFRRFATALIAGVFDGATSLQEIPALADLPVGAGQLVSRLLAHQLSQIDAQVPLRDFLLRANALSRTVILDHLPEAEVDWHVMPASSATVVKIDLLAQELEIAHVLDSWCIVYRGQQSDLLTGDRNRAFDEEVLQLMVHIADERGITPREARQDPRVQEALIHSRRIKSNASNGLGVGVINGDPAVAAYIEFRRIPLDNVSAVVLGTDGLVPLRWSLDRDDDRLRLLREIEQRGVEGLLTTTRESQAADPEWRVPRFKASDDATGIGIFFGEKGLG